MAIKITPNDNGDGMTVEINNGHAEALKKITEDYNISSESDAIGFMLSVFVNGEGRPIEIGSETYVPTRKIKKTSEHGS